MASPAPPASGYATYHTEHTRRVSVILTVKNEAHSLPRLLDSLAAQTWPPDEIVICDGGSTDDTLAILRAEKRLPLQVIVRPGANISQGRNAAIEAASGDIIAVTDGGVWLEPCWLEELVAGLTDRRPTMDDGRPTTDDRRHGCETLKYQVVAGFFLPDPHTLFEVAMGATVLPQLSDIQPRTFMPSSRSVAFTKAAWQAVGGYPEWLDFCEDLVFDFALRDLCGPFAFAPQAIAHFRPRSTLRAFFKQYYQYARGDGKARLFFRRHLIRYLTYLVAAPLILLAGWQVSPTWWGLYLLALPFMFFTPYKRLVRLWGHLTLTQRVKAAAWIPVIRITGDVAKMFGYPVGVVWRWRHKPSAD